MLYNTLFLKNFPSSSLLYSNLLLKIFIFSSILEYGHFLYSLSIQRDPLSLIFTSTYSFLDLLYLTNLTSVPMYSIPAPEIVGSGIAYIFCETISLITANVVV